MSLVHLTLIVLLSAVFAAAASLLAIALEGAPVFADPARLELALTVALPLLYFPFVVLLAWPICRALHIWPMRWRLPPCPHCRSPRESYLLEVVDWPRTELSCPQCGGRLELWLQRAAGAAGADLPRFRLRWPEFLGLWRRA